MPEYAEDDQDEDEEVHWVYDYDGWHGHVQDAYGVWYETDGCGTYWTGDDYNDLTAEQIKELDEAYAVYDNKVRTFQQSRQFQRSKGKSRGFYPVKMMKGKGKGKGKKGKGKASSSGPSSPSSKPMFMTQTNAEVMNVSGNNNGGCFICGDKGHGFRMCPKRADSRSQAPTSTSSRPMRTGAYWVESLTPSSLDTVFMATPADEHLVKYDDQLAETFTMDYDNDEHDPPIMDTFNALDPFNVVATLEMPADEKPEHCIYMMENAELITDTTGYGVLD